MQHRHAEVLRLRHRRAGSRRAASSRARVSSECSIITRQTSTRAMPQEARRHLGQWTALVSYVQADTSQGTEVHCSARPVADRVGCLWSKEGIGWYRWSRWRPWCKALAICVRSGRRRSWSSLAPATALPAPPRSSSSASTRCDRHSPGASSVQSLRPS